MTYYDPQGRCTVRITCGGEPLDGPYLPPASDLALLGRILACKYGAKDAQLHTDKQTNSTPNKADRKE